MKDPRRVFFEIEGRRIRFLRFAETANSDVLLWAHGLLSPVAQHVRFLPDLVITEAEMRRPWLYREADVADLPGRLEHMTFHRDATFHLKLITPTGRQYRHELFAKVPVAMDRSAAPFLDLDILSDRFDFYTSPVDKYGPADVGLAVERGGSARVRAFFAGLEFPLREWADRHGPEGVAYELRWPTFRAMLKIDIRYRKAPSWIWDQRPRGTIFRARFFAEDGKHRIKEFLFA